MQKRLYHQNLLQNNLRIHRRIFEKISRFWDSPIGSLERSAQTDRLVIDPSDGVPFLERKSIGSGLESEPWTEMFGSSVHGHGRLDRKNSDVGVER